MNINTQHDLNAAPVHNPAKTRKHHIYLRVSRDSQDNQNQELSVMDWIRNQGITNYQIIRENILSTTPWRERGLATVMQNCITGDVIVVAEFTRIGRNAVDVLGFLEECIKRGVTIQIVKSNMTLGDNMTSQVLAMMLSLQSALELGFIRSRTRDALERRKRELIEHGFFIGKDGQRKTSLGRQHGSRFPSKLEPRKTEVLELLKAGVAYRAIARLTNTNERTVARFAKENHL